MQVIANGKSRPIEDGWTVADFIRSLGSDPRYVIVELNGEALDRNRFTEVRMVAEDRIEVVRAVAGG
jgi:sulfur carrier protein